MKKIILLFILLPFFANAQEDLLGELEKEKTKETDYTFATFKGTRLVNGHTIETKNAGSLEFIFQHRFGALDGGLYEMFGLDEAYVRLGLDYGITDNLSVSIGRNSADKIMDGYLKYKILKQSSGEKNMPFSITALGGAAYSISPKKDDEPEGFKSVDRLAYTGQLLIARKITSNLSLQLMPTFIHKNAVNKFAEKNDQIAIGFGGRLKVTKSVALTTEYYYRLDPPDNDLLASVGDEKRYNALGFGIDIETGGHVFQLVLTNTSSLTERTVITETNGDFFGGDIHLGFNVTRTFQLKKNK
ncbi:DUF5777 family beta-barrel protein [Pseudochryseolinea flava]|uniref:DUF5777 domain-containing protein n=1 Tax=Pseudochryseolinea flava TaxID=2059302 RepID=A0A364Y3S9_9BACT|nr:DUF5777 family beta-barrel protein [Pseudochryseolinea flava]RAW01470.1 hypothetical protein DQQ10_09975 [Pseudochryseolinea flava]